MSKSRLLVAVSSPWASEKFLAPIADIANRLEADVIVAHNLAFDRSIMKTALHRLGGKPDRMGDLRQVCTMEASTEILKLPGRFDSYKWPSLGEAYRFFTERELEGAHDALVDSEACLAVFRCLVERGVISL